MTDLLERIRTELDQRLAALRPSVEEYERLLRGAEALAGIVPAATQAAAPRAKPAGRTKARRATKAKRAKPGETQRRVIEVLRDEPGSTSTAVAKAVGITTNAAAATISRLVKQGRVQRRAEGGYVTAELAAPTAATPAPADVEPETQPLAAEPPPPGGGSSE